MRLPLNRRNSGATRLFVIRGDIKSTTGYAKATQALASLLSEQFEVVGVDRHPNPADADGPFPFATKLDSDIPELISRADARPIVLHYTTPDAFQYFPGAINIGFFYWETDVIPFKRNWNEIVQAMDHMWAPTSFVADFVRRCGFSGPVSVVPWPHDPQPEAKRAIAELKGTNVYYVPAMTDGAIQRTIDAGKFRRNGGNIFLAVQSLAPRKGLPILLSEWRDHVASKSTKDILLLKLRFIHSSRIGGTPSLQLQSMLKDAGFRKDDPVRIAMISDDLSDAATLALYGAADAYITATYGEGFGGPVAEAICCGCLVIAPRHTGIVDLLPPDYPLIIAHATLRVGLRGNPSVYPHSSIWRLPTRGALRAALERFADLTQQQRESTLAAARSHLAAFCSTVAVRSALQSAIDGVFSGEVSAPWV